MRRHQSMSPTCNKPENERLAPVGEFHLQLFLRRGAVYELLHCLDENRHNLRFPCACHQTIVFTRNTDGEEVVAQFTQAQLFDILHSPFCTTNLDDRLLRCRGSPIKTAVRQCGDAGTGKSLPAGGFGASDNRTWNQGCKLRRRWLWARGEPAYICDSPS
jgi:hypothetical protein